MIAKAVKQRRLALGISQHELARRSGLKQPFIWTLESGTSTNPGIDKIQRLAAALHCTVDDLLAPSETKTGAV